ncbi:uncharacterized protein LOC124594823 [Schistocerca americana]|uniref:uncharacterized protein LOC124594823 n=1 Tax=Schistocerca americana TaxID=7009 RepID=UPI001F503C59|nr:uncharacterized protein LOC124594823 [Schistocerca americana]XP_049770958.1 uncharacterized protein LOC126110722 [Schistocerca cancellata]XP_049848022.1 uncharacterized protein LOC126306438 [Schistocerca gregaria]
MGNKITAFFQRVCDYPIKRKPICFLRQEDYSSTGQRLRHDEAPLRGPPTEYDKLVEDFYAKLQAHRKEAKHKLDERQQSGAKRLVSRFPGWNEMTITNLHNMFLLFDSSNLGMLNFDDFCAILGCLGDESPYDVRKLHHDTADKDMDGCISYEEFLSLVYNFDPPEDNEIRGLAKLCLKMADDIKFVGGLSLGEQLEYGLF